ncbi:putative spermidine/putrescine transport system ATP-binding protein [Halogranum amylolyticum]|uniref:Molybdate/tungstate import ATP-binding protein WtpC n=1 Tax=Halogranum amylolyticum TaxID=660520 RepID=A0A1H8TNK9_9EURY|nr:ABC transporter ATP-binding protein [Halogranum amylolyticum]SEO92640.1 putative spermidine/putrescine transport system ATP-binding protein [Halogranum amylolyticum]
MNPGRLDVDVRARFTADGTDPFVVDAALSVAEGETLVVLGPSGSGKSLLLETIAGFHAHEGAVVHDGRDLTDTPPEKREFGFVFQDYALFPHLTVRENVDFGSRYHAGTADPDDLLAELGVADLADRTPTTLSGGERQRVALARSLAIHPTALLLDEPLSALDVPTRQALRADLLDLLDGVTALYVTHNRSTARALGDRVAVMHDGELLQIGTSEEVFESPASPFVARFTGANVLPATVWSTGDTAAGDRGSAASSVAIRPEHLVLDPATPDCEATVERVVREDAAFRVSLSSATRTRSERVAFDAFCDDPPAVGDTVGVGVPTEHVTRFRE